MLHAVTVPVLMAVWQRVHLLERTLDRLAAQEGVSVDFYIVNNNPTVAAAVEQLASRFAPPLRVAVAHGDNALGCFGRWVHLARLRHRYPFLVVIDDDQVFDSRFLRTLWEDKVAGGIAACHAFAFDARRAYWEKRRLRPGERATYCGPGGMIIDSRLLDSRRLLACPQEYMMLDDLWLSHVVDHHLRAPMVRSSAMVTMTDRAGDTWWRLYDRKIAALETLRRSGWRV